MVSTRLMSSVGTANGGSEGAGPSHGEPAAVPRVTRHSSSLLPGGSSPHAHSSSSTKYNSLLPAPRTFTTNLLDLPIEVLEKIFHYLGYKSVSQMRMVNRQLNTICSSVLNSTFQRLQNQMLNRFQAIKAKMPRRESARRSHPLACESDIIETLHMRLTLLQMTFGKHIERKHCCFFPGEILDEVYSILSYLKTATKLARPYKVTDELFDLTTMAMEYFKEHIEPNLPEITYFGTDFFDITTAFSPGESSKSYLCAESPAEHEGGVGVGGGAGGGASAPDLGYLLDESLPPSPPPPQSNMVLRKRIHRIKQGMKKYNDQLSALRSDLRSCKRKTALQQKQIAEQQKQIAEQQKQTLEYANRLDDYDKKNEETSRKFQTLLQELNKCKTELQYWRSRSPAVPPLCAECGASLHPAQSSQHPPKHFWLASTSTEMIEPELPTVSIESPPIDIITLVPEDTKPKEVANKATLQCKSSCIKMPVAGSSGVNSSSRVAVATHSGRGVSVGGGGGVEQQSASNKEARSESSGSEGGGSPARRRPSLDGATPDRKKRRLTRPRKL